MMSDKSSNRPPSQSSSRLPSQSSNRPPSEEQLERVIDALEEITQKNARLPSPHLERLPVGSFNPKSWSWFTVLLTIVLGVGALIGGLGRAFFVQREEYEAAERKNAVEHENMRQTLTRVNETLQAQTQVLNEMAKALQAQAVELAMLKRGK